MRIEYFYSIQNNTTASWRSTAIVNQMGTRATYLIIYSASLFLHCKTRLCNGFLLEIALPGANPKRG